MKIKANSTLRAFLAVSIMMVISRGVFAVAPANDTCANAEIIPAAGPFPYLSTLLADVTGATNESQPPLPSCANDLSRSVWYRFTPAVSADYSFSTAHDTGTTARDTVMALYRSTNNCAGPFTEIACNDQQGGSSRAALSTNLLGGATYYIVVWLYTSEVPIAGQTALQLRVSKPAVPANDLCSGAIVIPSAGTFPYLASVVDITKASVTNDPPAPGCSGAVSRGVWYRFNPAVSAIYNLSTCASDTATLVRDTVMAIYLTPGGSCAGPFTEVACSDDECGTHASLELPLTAGANYYILVWEFDTGDPLPGQTALQLRIAPPAPQFTITLVQPDGDLVMYFNGLSGQPYTVQASETLEAGDWFDVGSPTDLGNNLFSYTVPNPTTRANRFYRVRSP